MPDFCEAFNLTIMFLRTPAQTWKNSSEELKIAIHNMIFMENPKYSVNTGFGTPKLSLPFLLKQQISDINSGLVDRTGLEPATPSLPAMCSTS